MKTPKTHCAKCASLTPNVMNECDCDGYHTFGELYDHRVQLFISFCKAIHRVGHPVVWRSKLHSDGSSYPGWFVLGIDEKSGRQITYHLPDTRWNDCDDFETHDHAPEFDGHTSDDALKRLKELPI